MALILLSPSLSLTAQSRNTDLARRPTSNSPLGRTLNEFYSSLGSIAETGANRAAHVLGLGPLAISARIDAFFGAPHEREHRLNELKADNRKMRKDCSRLMEYALPSESSETQMHAFKSMCRYIQRVEITTDVISVLWDRPGVPCELEWNFWRNFAAECMADIDISAILEESPRSASISVTQDGLSVVERLLVATDSVGPSDFSALIAVKYLGGILERPSFWLQTGLMYEAIVKKVIVKTAVFLKDIGVDSPEDIIPIEPSDVAGIDILCQALLQGIHSWMVGDDSDLTGEFWYEPLLQVILLLRQPKSEDLLPNSWAFATTPEMKRCIPTSSRIQIFSALVAPGSLGPSNGAIPSYTPRLEPPKSQRVSQPAFFGYFGLKGTPLPDHESDLGSQAQFPAEEDTFPPIATGSGATEVLSSDGGTETEVSSPAVTRKTDSRGWWPWRAFHLSKIRNAAHVQYSNDPATASTAPKRPAPTNGESPFPDPVRNSSTSPETSSHLPSSPSRNPPDPENPLVIFNSRAQKRNLSVGWVYSARHPTKIPDSAPPAQGEPLHVWSVKVLVDGKEFGHGTGNSKKAGRRAAAQQALALMNAQGSTQSLSSSSHSHSHSARHVESGSELTNEQPATT